MSYDELPMSCRQCAHRHSQYIYPSWSHKRLKVKPMTEGCKWKAARHPNFEEAHHAGIRDKT